MSTTSLRAAIDAAPILAITAGGFGPLGAPGRSHPDAVEALRELQASVDGVGLAIETIGLTGTRLLVLLVALGGTVTADDLVAQTAHADPAVIDAALTRLEAAGLVTIDPRGEVTVTRVAASQVAVDVRSLADPQAVPNDDLGIICRHLGLPVAARKAERVEAIAATFADPGERDRIRDELSTGALVVLERIADASAVRLAPAAEVGFSPWELRAAAIRAQTLRVAEVDPGRAALAELGVRGIVGVDSSEGTIWIWREAWPLLERPVIADWTVAPPPAVVPHRPAGEPPVPAAVGLLDALLTRWRDQPPVVLKNDEPRLGRPETRAAAKALKTSDATVDLLARLAISMRLLLPNEVARSGRGRNQRIDRAWKPDPDLGAAWAARSARHRWGRLVAEWCAPQLRVDPPLLANRHLVLWELHQLAPDAAYDDDTAFAAWFADRYAPIADAATAAECLADLRALGVVTPAGVALTERAVALFADPTTAVEAPAAEATRAFVQADLTVIAPPDLRHDLVLALDRIAHVESAGGATIYRLDAARITKAVQAGDPADTIVARLRDLAGGDLPDSVVRLVHDAAARAHAVRVASASTVVVVDDPADLTVACAIASLRLTRLAPTVAVTDVAIAKVHAALDAKGIAPKIVNAPGEPARSSRAIAEQTEQLAAQYRGRGRGPGATYQADLLDAQAKALRDIDARLAVPPALTLTPAAAAALVEPT